MNDDYKHLQNLGICILVLAALTLLAYFVAPIVKPVEELGLATSPQAVGLRFFFMGLGALAILGICYATREQDVWEVNAQKIVYMVIGSVIYGVLGWLFNGSTLPIPPLSQVPFQPAVVVPVLFGFMYGPVVGFMAGAGGSLISNLFVGVVSPHWALANGLIGLAAGATALFDDKRQAWDVAAVAVGLGGILGAAFFLANSGSTFSPPPDFVPTKPSLFMGLSVLVGCGLAIAVRFAFPNRPGWAEAAVWGAVGNVVGLLLASLADIWVSQSSFQDTVVGQFIPAAGPNIIAVAVLVPLLMAAQAAAQQAEASAEK